MSKKEKKNKKVIHQPDDRFFKQVMEDRKNAKNYLKNFYPELAAKLDLRTLKSDQDGFLTPEFDLFKADVIYRCQLKNSDKHLNLALIWEHKVRAEKNVAIQLGLYIYLALNKMVNTKGRKLEPIIPLLFYNGKEKWEPQTLHQLFEKHPYFDGFKHFLPSFNFLFKNITTSSEEELYQLQNAFFRSAMIAMASRSDSDLIFQRLSVIFDLEGTDIQLTILSKYAYQFMDRSKEEIKEAFENVISNNSKNKIMSTLEMLLAEGMEKGMEKGAGKGAKLEAIQNLLKIIHRFPQFQAKEIIGLSDASPTLIKSVKAAIRKMDSKELSNLLYNKYRPSVILGEKEIQTIETLVKKLFQIKL